MQIRVAGALNLQAIVVRPVVESEEANFKKLMQAHHYLGSLPKIGETIYKATNWLFLGHSKGFQRTREHYSQHNQSPKMVFTYPLQRNAQALMSQPVLNKKYQYGRTKIMMKVEHMRALPDFFIAIPDPRREQGRRHSLPSVLAIDGKTMRGAIGEDGRQTHIMSAIGHNTQDCNAV